MTDTDTRPRVALNDLVRATLRALAERHEDDPAVVEVINSVILDDEDTFWEIEIDPFLKKVEEYALTGIKARMGHD